MERREHFNEDRSGETSIDFDIATGRVWSQGTGLWTLAQAHAFFEDWRDVVGRIHTAGRPVSALADMSSSPVQRAEVADYITIATRGLYTGDDAIAMLVPTSLAKMQMRRVLDPRFHEFFVSRHAAELWLTGPGTRRLARA